MATTTGTTNDNKYDVLILGGGPGGTRAAYLLGKAGKRVCLISNDLGGECLNFGCIPTKTYLWTAELYEKLQHAELLGIQLNGTPQINWPTLQKRKNDVVGKLKKGLRFKLEKHKVIIKDAMGKLKDEHTIEISETGEILTGDFIILATGSLAAMIPGFEKSERVLTSREILDIPEIPQKLLVVGAGAVGVEFASLFSALGSKVTIAESSDRALPGEDIEISAELERIFIRKNIEIIKNVRISPENSTSYDKVLIAVGRQPTISEDIKHTGVTTGTNGVTTDSQMRTNIPSIFAIGDMAGKAFTAYTADREGEIAANAILGKSTTEVAYEIVVNTIFSMPEVASAGAREQTLKQSGISYAVGKSTYSTIAKALIMDNRDGFAKVIISPESGKLLGVHIIGEKASELIAEAALALSTGISYQEFSKSIHSHPVLGEVIKEACDQLS